MFVQKLYVPFSINGIVTDLQDAHVIYYHSPKDTTSMVFKHYLKYVLIRPQDTLSAHLKELRLREV